MNEFEKFLEENNYEDDLEFQLCDLEMAFNAGKELQWKPSEFHLESITDAISMYKDRGINAIGLKEVLDELKKLKEE